MRRPQGTYLRIGKALSTLSSAQHTTAFLSALRITQKLLATADRASATDNMKPWSTTHKTDLPWVHVRTSITPSDPSTFKSWLSKGDDDDAWVICGEPHRTFEDGGVVTTKGLGRPSDDVPIDDSAMSHFKPEHQGPAVYLKTIMFTNGHPGVVVFSTDIADRRGQSNTPSSHGGSGESQTAITSTLR